MIEELDTKRAVLYARVSTSDHDQRVETQEREMREYCKNNNIEVVAYYFDEKTGTTTIRQGLMTANPQSPIPNPQSPNKK